MQRLYKIETICKKVELEFMTGQFVLKPYLPVQIHPRSQFILHESKISEPVNQKLLKCSGLTSGCRHDLVSASLVLMVFDKAHLLPRWGEGSSGVFDPTFHVIICGCKIYIFR